MKKINIHFLNYGHFEANLKNLTTKNKQSGKLVKIIIKRNIKICI